MNFRGLAARLPRADARMFPGLSLKSTRQGVRPGYPGSEKSGMNSSTVSLRSQRERPKVPTENGVGG
jgi:hypothetical protein